MADLVDLIDALDRVVASSEGAAPQDDVERAARVAARARARRGYLGETLVVALAGGTGSGKSSLVNAFAGEEVTPAGAFRPTTSEPFAWIPARPEPGLVRLLDDLGIVRRVGQDSHPWLALIDLPDTDSVELGHRLTVERLLPEVDAVVWVVDPEKYQDRSLHEGQLAPLAAYAGQFVFALNQTDRLRVSEVPVLAADLRETLEREGIAGAPIVAVAADPDLGEPAGLDELLGALRGLGEAKAVVNRKIVTDIAGAADALGQATGAGTGSTGFVQAWERVSDEAAAAIVTDVLGPDQVQRAVRRARAEGRRATGILPGRNAPAQVDLGGGRRRSGGANTAVAILDRHIGELARSAGGEVAGELRGIGASVDEVVRATVAELAFGETLQLPPPPAWTTAAAWLRRLAAAGAVMAVVWLVDRLRSGGELVPPAAAILVLMALLVVPAAAAAAGAGRSAARELDRSRGVLEVTARRALDRRLGRPLREALRRRAAVSAALAELELLRRSLE